MPDLVANLSPHTRGSPGRCPGHASSRDPVPAHAGVTLWQPLLDIVRQSAELQSQREAQGPINWLTPLVIGLLGGAALRWLTLKLLPG